MRVLVATFDLPSFPSARLRLLDPLAVAGGFELRPAFEANANGGFVFRNDLVGWADVIVTQRSFPRPETRAVRSALLASGKPVVYETDDCLPEIPDFIRKPHYRAWGPEILDWAGRVDAVTVPTAELADYFAPHARRVEVLPNFITGRTRPETLARRPASATPTHIGYAGNPGHRGDLAMVAPALLRILARRPEVHVHFFGAIPDGFPAHPRVGVTPADFDYDAFPARLASFGWHFALAPLVDNLFNRCVSPLKYYEYGALAIPGVFSPRPAYAGVRDGETGLIAADDPVAWETAIDRLCDDVDLRERIAANAHRDVRAHHLLEPHAHRWSGFYRALRKVAAPAR
jgi:glycosyltransferase involved in cell wall biosynthesis